MAYSGKYKGAEIDSLLDRVANGNIGGGSGKKVIVELEVSSKPYILNPNEVVVIASDNGGRIEIDGFTLPEYDDTKDVTEQGGLFYAEYTMVFRAINTTLTLPDYVLWAYGAAPEIEENVDYELSISFRGRMPLDGYYKAVLVPFKAAEV